MSTHSKEPATNCNEKCVSPEDQRKKISEVRKIIGPLPEKLSIYCSDASISRYLRARNWNARKAGKMMKETLKWRLEYKPDEIRWENVAVEAETGKIYKSNVVDKQGRPVLVLRPSRQNSNSIKEQIKHFVYLMENAIMNLPATQEQMVWLIDFHNFSLTNISVMLTKETAHVLQEHYPERLGLAIMYDPPKIFEQFWSVVKVFLEPKTRGKVKFVYSDDVNTKKIMEDLFDMDQLEPAFGGNNPESFNIQKYVQKMQEDDKRMASFWMRANRTDVAPNGEATCPDFNGAEEGNSALDDEAKECTSDEEAKEHVSDEKDEDSSASHRGGLDDILSAEDQNQEGAANVK